jgi:hypothetical protein
MSKDRDRSFGFRWLGSGMPLSGMIVMSRWVSRCGACVVVLIDGVLREIWNGCGQRVSGAGMRRAGWWGTKPGAEMTDDQDLLDELNQLSRATN